MLRTELGNDIFFKGLRKYYADYQNSTALTKDFQKVMEIVSQKDLEQFFCQWLWQVGHPVLDLDWKQNEKQLNIQIKQIQEKRTFTFPLEVELHYSDGSTETEIVQMNKLENSFVFDTNKKVENIIPDPGVKLLFEIN